LLFGAESSHRAEIARVDVTRRVAEGRRVGEVEGLGAELQPHAFADAE
jgi:hypothetical protein